MLLLCNLYFVYHPGWITHCKDQLVDELQQIKTKLNDSDRYVAYHTDLLWKRKIEWPAQNEANAGADNITVSQFFLVFLSSQ